MNNGYMLMSLLMIPVLLAFGVLTKASDEAVNNVAYPDGYRDWTHIKSMLILPGHTLEDPFQGLHHIYANDKAVEGYGSGNFEKGSVIVFDLLEYKKQSNSIVEGERKLLGVMVKDNSRFSNTGGWGFEGFSGNSKTERLTSDGGQSCFSCHMSQKNSDYVFSKFRE